MEINPETSGQTHLLTDRNCKTKAYDVDRDQDPGERQVKLDTVGDLRAEAS